MRDPIEEAHRALEEHYKKAGFLMNSSPSAIERNLKRLFGKKRYEDYLEATDAHRAGEGIERVYACAKTVHEANVLICESQDPT